MSTLSVDTIQGQTTAANVKLPAGYVIQTQYAQSMTQVSTTTTSLASPTETGLNVTITPKYSSSKILLMISASMRGDGTAYVNALIKRNTTLIDLTGSQTNDGVMDYAHNVTGGRSHFQFLDSPATTSAITYKFCFSRYGGSGTAYFNNNGSALSLSSFVAMEIAQ